jgi:hypothetical protein
MNEGSDTQASPDHDFMDEDPPFAPTSPFPHNPMNEELENTQSPSPYHIDFEDYAPNSPPFYEHMHNSLPRVHPHSDRDDNIYTGSDHESHTSNDHDGIHHSPLRVYPHSDCDSDHESHTGSNHDDMASGTNNDRGHTRSARVTRAYHMVINGMCPLLFISFINDIDPFVYRKTL